MPAQRRELAELWKGATKSAASMARVTCAHRHGRDDGHAEHVDDVALVELLPRLEHQDDALAHRLRSLTTVRSAR